VKETPPSKKTTHKRWNNLAVCFACLFSLGTAQAEETTVEIIHYFNVKDQQDWLSEIITDFQQKNPDIKVQLTYVPFPELVSRTLQTAAVRRPPAIAAIDNPDVLRVAKAGVLKDISGSMSQFPDWKNIYKGPKNAITDGDHVYAIPIGSNSLALYYNKKMFADAGVQEPPKTWDELVEVAKKVTKSPIYGIAFSAPNDEQCTWQWEPFLWSNGGSLLDLSSDKAKQALKLWVDLVQNGSASHDVVNWQQGDAYQFIGGTAAMMVMGPWMLPAVKRSGVDFGIVPIPAPKAGDKPVVPLGGECWCVMKNDKKVEDAALKFIGFVQDPERLIKLCLTFNYISSFRDVAAKESEAQPDLQPFVAQMDTARARPEEGGAQYPQVSQIARTAIQRALTGQGTINASLDDAAAQVKKLGIKK
jgi:multiple sugar transport system substrate-binding protein